MFYQQVRKRNHFLLKVDLYSYRLAKIGYLIGIRFLCIAHL